MQVSSPVAPVPGVVTPANPKGNAAPQVNTVTPATSKAAAVAADALTKTQKKKLTRSEAEPTPEAVPSALATAVASPSLAPAVILDEKSKDGPNADLLRENAELKKRVEVLGQQAQKAIQFVERVTEFMKKNFQVENDKSAVAPSEFQAVMRQHTLMQDEEYKVTMERLDIVVNEINVLLATAGSLKDRVLGVKAQEIVPVADKHAVQYPKQNFEAELQAFESSLAATSEKVLFLTETNEVKKHLKKLNKMTVISSEERIKLRDDFTTKWNKVCLLSHTLKFDNFYLKRALSFLPQINHFIPTLDESYNKAVETRRNNREATTKNWDDYKKSFESKRDEFLNLDKQMVVMQKQLGTLLDELKAKEIPPESYTAFAAHNPTVEEKNRASLTEVFGQYDDLNKKLAKMIVNQWQLACEKIGKLAAEMDHIGTEAAAQSVKYNASVKTGSYATPSVVYDLKLMPK